LIQCQQGFATLLFCAAVLLAGCSGDASRQDSGPASTPLAAAGQDTQGPFAGIETFTVGEDTVASYRYAAVVPPWGRLYAFCVTPAAAPPYVIVLGSYDDTTRIAREMVAIGAGERIFHLDRHDDASATTLALFGQPPTYETTRALVVAAVAGRPVETATHVPLGVALAHAMIAIKAVPPGAQTGGPCAAARS